MMLLELSYFCDYLFGRKVNKSFTLCYWVFSLSCKHHFQRFGANYSDCYNLVLGVLEND